MPDIPAISTNTIMDIIKYLATFVIGGFAFIIREKYTNRKAIFTKRTWKQRLAFSHQSQAWGDIQILYDGVPSNNLHILSAEIINTSDKDIPKLMFEFSVSPGCTIYRHLGQLFYDNLTKDLTLQKEFNDKFECVKTKKQEAKENAVPIDAPLQNDIVFVTSHRRFDVPLIKGKTKAIFQFLVEDIENNPDLNISILEPNITVTTYQDDTERKSVKRKWSEYGGLILFLVFSYPIYYYSSSISTAVWLMIINLFIASYLSLGMYYIYHWIRKILQ